MFEEQISSITSTTYRATVKCANCDNDSTITVPKGSLIKDQSCPNCLCKRLVVVKDSRPTLTYRGGGEENVKHLSIKED